MSSQFQLHDSALQITWASFSSSSSADQNSTHTSAWAVGLSAFSLIILLFFPRLLTNNFPFISRLFPSSTLLLLCTHISNWCLCSYQHLTRRYMIGFIVVCFFSCMDAADAPSTEEGVIRTILYPGTHPLTKDRYFRQTRAGLVNLLPHPKMCLLTLKATRIVAGGNEGA